jgi:hypothetical protein
VCLGLDRPSLGFTINKKGVDPIKNLDWSTIQAKPYWCFVFLTSS